MNQLKHFIKDKHSKNDWSDYTHEVVEDKPRQWTAEDEAAVEERMKLHRAALHKHQKNLNKWR